MITTTEHREKFHDFNHKNVALICAVFVVLLIFMVAQGTLFSSVTKLGFTLGKYYSVFATSTVNTATKAGAVLGASTLSADVESRISALPITYAYKDTIDEAETYAEQVQAVESADRNDSVKLSQDLLEIAVPPTLDRYQRLIVIRAQLQAELAVASSDEQTQIQANVNAVTQQITQLQSSFASQGVTLPS